MKALYEMHFHTKEVSACGMVPAGEAVKAFQEQGYAGIVVTDHFAYWFFDSLPAEMSWPEKVDRYMTGYRAAREMGEKVGVKVFLGTEIRFTGSDNDYLVYGWDEELLKNTPAPYNWKVEEFSRFAREHGLFFAQAHPFRAGLTRCDPALLDGLEVFNGNRRGDSHNDQAAAFAAENNLRPLSGSDFHQWEDLQGAGLIFDEAPQDAAALVRALREGTYVHVPG